MGLIFGLILVAQHWVDRAPFAIDANLVWVGVVGVIITVIAGWLPAGRAMRVSPLEAMRPVAAMTVESKAGRIRLVFGALLFIGGATVMVIFARHGEVGLAIVAGAVSFIGVLLLSVLFVPAAAYGLGWITRATGVPGKMAQLNSTRNRSRTAATAAALIIGTTLVAMILTGGRTFQHNSDQLLATNYPVDIYADLTNVDARIRNALMKLSPRCATPPESKMRHHCNRSAPCRTTMSPSWRAIQPSWPKYLLV